MNTYVMMVLELDSLVRKLVLGSLGVDKYVGSLAKSAIYNYRLMRYAAPGTEESKKPGTGSHRDANLVTILHQNDVNGLEVQTKDGCWIEVAPSSTSSSAPSLMSRNKLTILATSARFTGSLGRKRPVPSSP